MAGLNEAPGYVRLLESGELSVRVAQARRILSSCTLCPRQCKVNRGEGETGVCGASNRLFLAHYGAHFGEEPPLTGEKGAGTIFFSNCTLKCCYCQNYQISQDGLGYEASAEELAGVMIRLQELGCHNIDLVTPTHYLPFILRALCLAAEEGLAIPLVYNCGGYESVETLKLLDGVVDIYLPDWKYGEEELGRKYSKAPLYPSVCRDAVLEMYRQVGDLIVDENSVARRGLIVRHLILPQHLSNSGKVLFCLAKTLPPSVKVSLMSQYSPRFQSPDHPELNRPLLPEEYREARSMIEQYDFDEYWVQELESGELYLPDFRQENPFNRPFDGE